MRAVLEDPKTPVLVKVCDLIFRVVVRPEAVFDTHTQILPTEVDNVLRVGLDDLRLERLDRHSSKRTYLANPLGIIEQSNISFQPSREEDRACRVFQSRGVTIQTCAEFIKCC